MNTKPASQQTFSTKANAKRAIKAIGEYAADMADEFVSKDAISGIWIADMAAAKACQESCVKADAQETQPNEDRPLDQTHYNAEDEAREEAKTDEAATDYDDQPEDPAIDASTLAPYKDPTIPRRPAPTKKDSPSVYAEPNRVSTIGNPCLAVWTKADEMFATNPHTRRKDVIAACVTMGIAFYTARTQYQQWLTVNKDKIAAAKTATI